MHFTLQNILKCKVDDFDIVLTKMEDSYKCDGIDEDDIKIIMNPVYRALIIDAVRGDKKDKLKYFIDKYYKNKRDNKTNYYSQSSIYFHIYDYMCGTVKLLPLLKFVIKQQIKNSIQHDDYNCGYYDMNMHLAFIKYLYNIGYIDRDLREFFHQFDCNKFRI